ncbi:MAG: FliH/SctL family protein [Clostridium sp.]|nr:FliH/SctL family protein [Clostridium sp.]
MSNLIKSGFVAFSQDNTLVIDTNQSKIIKAIDEAAEEASLSMEEALAATMMRDAELEGVDFGDDLLTMDTSDLSDAAERSVELKKIADEVVRSAKSEAESIVNQAHDEAEQMRAAAYDEVEQIKQQAKEEGYQNGYDEGMAAAQEAIQAQTDEFEQRKQDLESDFADKEKALLQETESKMVDILCRLIPSVTGVVIEQQKDVLLYMINCAMRDLDNSKQFVIKVSTEDYEAVVQQKDAIYGALNPSIQIEIFEDAKLAPMQCLIETDHGIVDVSLDVQLHNLLTSLKLMIKEEE